MLEKIEDFTILLGTALGISNIETTLGIILLSFQILILVSKVILKITQSVKDKKITPKEKQEIQETIDETLAIIDDLEQKFKDKEDNK